MSRIAARRSCLAVCALALLALAPAPALAQDGKGKGKEEKSKEKRGLLLNTPKAFQGYTLFSPLLGKTTYLIDMEGRVVKKWDCDCTPGLMPMILENGNLLRGGALDGEEKKFGGGPGAAGRMQEFTWDGEVVWDFKLYNEKQLPHHDYCLLPNGNILMIVWDKKTREEAIAAGRKKDLVGDYLLPDSVVEVQKTGKTTGKVVWEWHLWDHLVQDHDKSKANFGKVEDHPELVDINFVRDSVAAITKGKDGDKLKGIGYTASPLAKKQRVTPDWNHMNGIAYNAELDQIVLSVHTFSEIWIIDHSTTTAEAASHKGGRSGKGGDLLYRWGNPRAYRQGTAKDQKLFSQHNAHWIPRGYPGAGNLLVFNNGGGRPDGSYSSVDELVLPVDAKGRYTYSPGTGYGPEKPVWSYTAPKKSDFFAVFISGAERLPNGNTLICSGPNGVVFEVTPEKETVWKYANPTTRTAKGPAGLPPKGMGFGPRPGEFEVLPGFVRDQLKLSETQQKELDAFQKEARAKLDKLLSEEQKKQLKDPKAFGAVPRPGEVMTSFQQARLKLSADQKKEVEGLQKETDTLLEKTLDEAQRKQLKEVRDAIARGGFGPPGGGFGGPNASSLFRAYRYPANYPGLAGRTLTPGKTVEELERKAAK